MKAHSTSTPFPSLAKQLSLELSLSAVKYINNSKVTAKVSMEVNKMETKNIYIDESKRLRSFFQFLTWAQGPEALGPPLLPFQIISKAQDWKQSSQDTNWQP